MPSPRESSESVNRVLARVFAPLHKRALGTAVGVTAGLAVFLVTAFHVIVRPVDGPPLWLLDQYFYGYSVTWAGAFVGLWWAFVAGFAAGWFFAFVRNLALAIWIFVIRTKASLAQTRDFLDHI
jgi:hypothetical protein